MMVLSYASILGGMTTLIGSSTNLLVSGMLTDLGQPGFGFFDFTLPGLAVALPGLVFALVVVRRLLPERSAAGGQGPATGRQFLAQIDVVAGRPLDGLMPAGGFFPDLADVTVHAIRRGEARLLPPFGGEAALRPGDILIVSATRQALTDAVRGEMDLLHPSLGDSWAAREDETHGRPPWLRGRQLLGEVLVTPGSELIGRTLEQIGFRYRYNCVVVGVQRRAARRHGPITDLPLAAGDVLLVQGTAGKRRRRCGGGPAFCRSSGLQARCRRPRKPGGRLRSSRSLSGWRPSISCHRDRRDGGRSRHAGDGRDDPAAGGASYRGRSRADHCRGARARQGAAGNGRGRDPFRPPGRRADRRAGVGGAVRLLPAGGGTCEPGRNEGGGGAVHAHRRFARPGPRRAGGAICGRRGIRRQLRLRDAMGYQTNLLVMGPAGYRFQDYVRAGLPMLLFVWATASLVLPFYYGL